MLTNPAWLSGESIWDGLLHAYSLNQTLVDSVSENNLYATNAVVYNSSGINNYCGAFNGTTNPTLQSTSVLTVNGNMPRTLSCWVKRTASQSDKHFVDTGKALSLQSFGWWYYTGTVRFYRYAGDLDLGFGLTLNQWHNLVLTHDGSTVRCYNNGLPTPINNTINTTLNTATSQLLIGKRDATDGRPKPWIGQVDEVYFWNRALSSTEVAQLYNSGAGIFYS